MKLPRGAMLLVLLCTCLLTSHGLPIPNDIEVDHVDDIHPGGSVSKLMHKDHDDGRVSYISMHATHEDHVRPLRDSEIESVTCYANGRVLIQKKSSSPLQLSLKKGDLLIAGDKLGCQKQHSAPGHFVKKILRTFPSTNDKQILLQTEDTSPTKIFKEGKFHVYTELPGVQNQTEKATSLMTMLKHYYHDKPKVLAAISSVIDSVTEFPLISSDVDNPDYTYQPTPIGAGRVFYNDNKAKMAMSYILSMSERAKFELSITEPLSGNVMWLLWELRTHAPKAMLTKILAALFTFEKKLDINIGYIVSVLYPEDLPLEFGDNLRLKQANISIGTVASLEMHLKHGQLLSMDFGINAAVDVHHFSSYYFYATSDYTLEWGDETSPAWKMWIIPDFAEVEVESGIHHRYQVTATEFDLASDTCGYHVRGKMSAAISINSTGHVTPQGSSDAVVDGEGPKVYDYNGEELIFNYKPTLFVKLYFHIPRVIRVHWVDLEIEMHHWLTFNRIALGADVPLQPMLPPDSPTYESESDLATLIVQKADKLTQDVDAFKTTQDMVADKIIKNIYDIPDLLYEGRAVYNSIDKEKYVRLWCFSSKLHRELWVKATVDYKAIVEWIGNAIPYTIYSKTLANTKVWQGGDYWLSQCPENPIPVWRWDMSVSWQNCWPIPFAMYCELERNIYRTFSLHVGNMCGAPFRLVNATGDDKHTCFTILWSNCTRYQAEVTAFNIETATLCQRDDFGKCLNYTRVSHDLAKQTRMANLRGFNIGRVWYERRNMTVNSWHEGGTVYFYSGLSWAVTWPPPGAGTGHIWTVLPTYAPTFQPTSSPTTGASTVKGWVPPPVPTLPPTEGDSGDDWNPSTKTPKPPKCTGPDCTTDTPTPPPGTVSYHHFGVQLPDPHFVVGDSTRETTEDYLTGKSPIHPGFLISDHSKKIEGMSLNILPEHQGTIQAVPLEHLALVKPVCLDCLKTSVQKVDVKLELKVESKAKIEQKVEITAKVEQKVQTKVAQKTQTKNRVQNKVQNKVQNQAKNKAKSKTSKIQTKTHNNHSTLKGKNTNHYQLKQKNQVHSKSQKSGKSNHPANLFNHRTKTRNNVPGIDHKTMSHPRLVQLPDTQLPSDTVNLNDQLDSSTLYAVLENFRPIR